MTEKRLPSLLQRITVMGSLILAGEAIFGLPFHVSRYFRPTFVDVFQISQTQLGILGATYGVVATFAYLFGGGIADRFSPRGLLVMSLLITGASGGYMATIPPFVGMCGLYAFWGVSTILVFWPALIRATREWGGAEQQGVAFGILDGGRGLFAAILAMLSLGIFAVLLPSSEEALFADRRQAMQAIIGLYTIACGVAALAVWFTLPRRELAISRTQHHVGSPLSTSGNLVAVLRMPAIWLQAMIIVAAYCTFKGIDYYSQYAKDVWGWSEVEAAGISAISSWMRPIAAIGAGLLADRKTASLVVIGCFALTGLAYLSFLVTEPASGLQWLLWCNVLISCMGLFALRGIYFALMEESNVPLRLTGSAVGVISFIGYTPEIFMPLLGGWLIDPNNQLVGNSAESNDVGYTLLFSVMLIASFAGIVATLALRSFGRREQAQLQR